jgi:tetratricopeptide (TPR) repeat protein
MDVGGNHVNAEGMDAMATRTTSTNRFAQLWQVPLLLVSLGLFGTAAYLFIDPQPGLSVEERITIARKYLDAERPRAALQQLNEVLTTSKMESLTQGRVHLMLAESLEMAQKEKKLNIPANHLRIIEQTRLASGRGMHLDARSLRRMAESYEALGRRKEALENYQKAMVADPTKSLALQRKIISMQLDSDDPATAEPQLAEYLKNKSITNAERAWATGEQAQLMIDAGKFLDARSLLTQALALEIDPVSAGALNYRMGYSAYKLNSMEEAERYLRVARDQLQVKHPLDGDAALLLGNIAQQRGNPAEAEAFYNVVLISHPDSVAAPRARMGRGLARILQKQDDAGLNDFHDLVNEILRKESRRKYKDDVLVALQSGSKTLSNRGNHQGAIELLTAEQTLLDNPPPSFFGRVGEAYEKLADQIDATIADASNTEKIKRGLQVRDLRTKAGDAYVAYSRGLTIADDKGYADAMWKGVELFDKAGNNQRVIAALELFASERPEDPQTPDALLRLGKAFQAAGLFDKAIWAYQKNLFRYPKTLAASKSAVPLAGAYVAKGPEHFGKAETTLHSVIDNNPLVTPDSEEFKQALFDLAQLFYRTNRFEEAVQRFEEFTKRYPADERMGQLLFLMGDSYRKSANLLNAKAAAEKTVDASNSAPVSVIEVVGARKDRLTKARGLYDRVIELYRTSAPRTDIDKLYNKLAHFYRADCMYDLGQYPEAIGLYDTAAFRYQEDPSALAAYVQIVNAYCALGKMEEAKTANERAKWLLRRMPQSAFKDGSFAMPKEYWEQWLKWTSDAGMW